MVLCIKIYTHTRNMVMMTQCHLVVWISTVQTYVSNNTDPAVSMAGMIPAELSYCARDLLPWSQTPKHTSTLQPKHHHGSLCSSNCLAMWATWVYIHVSYLGVHTHTHPNPHTSFLPASLLHVTPCLPQYMYMLGKIWQLPCTLASTCVEHTGHSVFYQALSVCDRVVLRN